MPTRADRYQQGPQRRQMRWTSPCAVDGQRLLSHGAPHGRTINRDQARTSWPPIMPRGSRGRSVLTRTASAASQVPLPTEKSQGTSSSAECDVDRSAYSRPLRLRLGSLRIHDAGGEGAKGCGTGHPHRLETPRGDGPHAPRSPSRMPICSSVDDAMRPSRIPCREVSRSLKRRGEVVRPVVAARAIQIEGRRTLGSVWATNLEASPVQPRREAAFLRDAWQYARRFRRAPRGGDGDSICCVALRSPPRQDRLAGRIAAISASRCARSHCRTEISTDAPRDGQVVRSSDGALGGLIRLRGPRSDRLVRRSERQTVASRRKPRARVAGGGGRDGASRPSKIGGCAWNRRNWRVGRVVDGSAADGGGSVVARVD